MATCITPNIIKETSSGMFACTIRDDMLLHREIECSGEIDAASASSLIRQIRYLARKAPGEEITLYINSPGGEVAQGLALYDVMRAVGCPIRTVCTGTAASMGALLFAAGHQRDMLPHAKVMIHDPLRLAGPGGSALDVKRQSDELLETRETTGKILAQHTHKTLEEIYEKTAKDTWFTAQEAVDFGLADRILQEI